MRSPSERLIQTLTGSGLCSRAEIDQCGSLVRTLCHDLPDFDSVWLDALVQQNSLTAWQAEQLQAPDGARIVVGRFHRSKTLGLNTWLAAESSSSRHFVLRKVPSVGFGRLADPKQRLSELFASVSKFRGSLPASLVIPLECLITEPLPAVKPSSSVEPADLGTREECATDDFVVSDYVAGWSMDELLVRGGRLPFDAVAEIGRELLAGLAWLESCGLLHGDITLRNVRIDGRGQVHLVDPFVRRLAQPHPAITDRLTLRDIEGVAPELVGSGRQPDTRSELYALGCVLWQLLTSR
ncbi:MAG: protein kinase domain-containing protein, partial [Planctomycetota bacterium]